MTFTRNRIPINLPLPIPDDTKDKSSGNINTVSGGVTSLIALQTVPAGSLWVLRFISGKIPTGAGLSTTGQLRFNLTRQGAATVTRFDKDVNVVTNIAQDMQVVLFAGDTIDVDFNNTSGANMNVSASYLIDEYLL